MRRMAVPAMVLILAVLLPPFGIAEPSVSQVLYERTTLHGGFDDTPLGQGTIDLLIDAAFSGPTGGYQRSLEFFVVTDRAVMQGIQQGHPYAAALDTAPLVVVIAGNGDMARYAELHEMDSGIAAMAMMVQATQLGLSSCVLSISPQESRIKSARKALSMPETWTPVLMVAFGYPDADAESSASVRSYTQTQVHVNGYAGAEAEPTDTVTGATPAKEGE